MQKKSCAVCGEGAVTDKMRQKWFAKFCAGDSLTVLRGRVDPLKGIAFKQRR